ncbi:MULTISPECIES: DUF4894 domain-containing protein [unclassified Marinitoga]|uniref:DUF4894 domain-containing protein n=1 Tax=unclassified Marinitoga TaxID=2640159 RepID=UPI000640F651|nr:MULTISPECIES: DUF4894 domain-containing protein [unclassified Marinitoga]KLO25180.1 hypothetical protein X274_00890 [Marinitoga sp. 1155]NUU98635.1 hypothetical protein [Marinitoga sp. 1154]
MNTARNVLFVLIMMYIFIIFYMIFQFFVTKNKDIRNLFVIQQPICVVEFNSRYLLLNKDEIIFKISDVPIVGYPIIDFNDYFIYKDDLAKLSIEQLSYISKINFEKKIIYINIGYKLFFNSWKDVLNHFDNTITKLIKKEPGNYFLLSGGSLISIY